MSRDLFALAVAFGLGSVVVILGLRRNLSETTRNGLPRFGEGGGQVAVAGPPGGRQRRRLSPRERRWLIGVYVLISLANAAAALFSADDRLFHAIAAALFALCAVGYLLRRLPFSFGGSSPGSAGTA